jgi:peroxiredoxin
MILIIKKLMPQTDFPLPDDLPEPVDDGQASHLWNTPLPEISLQSTAGRIVNLRHLHAPTTVLYCYPMTGVPGKPLPTGWDLIPGARGCTPQTCGFRDIFHEFAGLNIEVFGISTQSPAYQREMAARLHLPFEILSDVKFKLRDAMHLPTFEAEGVHLLKRLTLIVRNASIEHLFYPVFPPDQNADQVIEWIRRHPAKPLRQT